MNDTEFANWMKRMDAPRSGPSLPDADAIWWRAQLRRRVATEERATRPVRIAEQLACAVFLLAAVVLAAVR
ncbi:hypothetical protein SBA6_520001 [Candidatus Sulfopaludibacter sp. SbA6]|nr:hypothetical protein SBA6_520001 [Candidatus Sulfopaludibacter sp. SbA6]